MKNNSEHPASDADRSERLIELFEQARQLPPEQRAAFLIRACGEDEELRRELESLLEHAEPALPTSAIKLAARQLAGEEQQDWTGQQINQYRLLGVLGEGGMGKVYLAEDERLARRVAIKFLPETFLVNTHQVLRFEQEARTASALNHPNIITIHEIGQHEGTPYIAYELVEGRTLRRRLGDSALDWQEAVAIGSQIAAALKAAHSAGIIHRDIKPENVMLRADGLVKVLDFGIAKHFDLPATEGETSAATTAINATQAGRVLGTIGYLSPEQGRGEEIDARTDIFSLGVVIYEMLAGHPYAGLTPQEKLEAAISAEELPPIGAQHKALPAALDAIVLKATRKTRDERYESDGEMLDALSELRLPTQTKLDERERMLAQASANQLLNQSVALYASDESVRLSPAALWAIWRHSNIKRGRLESALMRRSLYNVLGKVGAIALLAGLVTVVFAAWYSIEEKWDERVLRDGHTAGVRRAVFSPDGKWLVSVGEDHQVLVWDFARRELKRRLTEHTGWVVAVAFAPDGKHFATASWDQTVIVWHAESLTRVAVLREQRAPLTGVAFSLDGKYLAAASDLPDSRAILWDARRWVKVRELPLGGGDWWPLLFSPTHPELLLAGDKASNVETGQEEPLSVRPSGSGVAFSPDGSRLVMVDANGRVTFVDFARQKVLDNPIVHRDHGRATAFSPDGKLVATGSEDIALWNAATRELITRWDHISYVWGLAFSLDGRYLVSTHGDGSILLWDMVARERVANLNQHSHPVAAVASAPDGRRIISGSGDRSVIVWDAATGRKEAVLLGHHSRITSVAISSDAQWAASLDQDGELIRWNIATRQPHWRKKKNGDKRLTVSLDDRWLATSSRVYDSSTGELVFNYDCASQVWCNYDGVSFSADGRRLATVGDRRVYLCDTQKWRLLGQAQTTHDDITVGLSPDGTQFVTGNVAGEITLWQAEPLRPVAVIGQHAARVKQVAFSHDSRRIVSVGDDKKIKLWDVRSQKLIQEIGAHASGVLSIAFSRDDRQLVSGEHDNSVRIYTRQRSLWGWRLR